MYYFYVIDSLTLAGVFRRPRCAVAVKQVWARRRTVIGEIFGRKQLVMVRVELPELAVNHVEVLVAEVSQASIKIWRPLYPPQLP